MNRVYRLFTWSNKLNFICLSTTYGSKMQVYLISLWNSVGAPKFCNGIKSYVPASRFSPPYEKLLYRRIMWWEWRWIFEWEIIVVRLALSSFCSNFSDYSIGGGDKTLFMVLKFFAFPLLFYVLNSPENGFLSAEENIIISLKLLVYLIISLRLTHNWNPSISMSEQSSILSRLFI